MRRPSRQDYAAFREHFDHSLLPGGHQVYETLRGNSRTLYEDRHDLVSLARADEEDRIFALLRNWIPSIFRTGEPLPGSTVAYASELAMRWTSALTSVLIAAAFLYGAILHFYFVTDPRTVLGLIAAYTTSFALATWLLTNAKRSEIFVACAAYAAVIVVFVSNPIGVDGRWRSDWRASLGDKT